MNKKIALFTDNFIPFIDSKTLSQWDMNLRESFGKYSEFNSIKLENFDSHQSDEFILSNSCINFDFIIISLHTDYDYLKFKIGWSTSKLKKLRANYKGKILVLFGDMELASQQFFSYKLRKIVDYIYYTALYKPLFSLFSNNYRYVFPVSNIEKTCTQNNYNISTIGYIGRRRKDRIDFVNVIHNKYGLNIDIDGGEREINLSYSEYVSNMNNFKFILSFSRVGLSHVLNLRPFEIIHTNSICIEQYSIQQIKLFIPYLDFIPFFSAKDFALKVTSSQLVGSNELSGVILNNKSVLLQKYNSRQFCELLLSGHNCKVYGLFDSIKYCPLDEKLIYLISIPLQRIIEIYYIFKFFLLHVIKILLFKVHF